MSRILSNQVVCHRCGDAPYSRSVHDFVSCECGAISVDGGMQYLRRVGAIHDNTDISVELKDKTFHECMEALESEETNDLGKLCAIARLLRDSGVLYKTEAASYRHSPNTGDARQRGEAGASEGLLS